MSVNRERPHVMVLPEDDANRELANGFHLGCGAIRQFQVLPPAGGWRKVCEAVTTQHAAGLRQYASRHLVLLMDFDGDPNRRDEVATNVPVEVAGRVFVLGVFGEPEDLKRLTRTSLEPLGAQAASDCRGTVPGIWDHEQLRHNEPELTRMRERLLPVLFPSR